MAYPPPPVHGQPPLFGAPPFPMPPGMQRPPGAAMLPLAPPGMPPIGFPPPPLAMVPPPLLNQHTVSAPPTGMDGQPTDVPMAMTTATMKVQTTVFVGNISEKASDTLVRQILLRCGQIEGWKRVKDASGKLQAFGFCEYALPESTLRAIRLLDGLKLGEKALVVKVDAKTRKDLLKYIITKNKGQNAKEEEVEAEVAKLEEEGRGTAALTDELSEDMKKEDGVVMKTIEDLLRDHLVVLSSSKTSEDVQREHDVQESILFMAKQSGNVDPDTTLDQVDMEDDMKMLVSDEIKRFRESYQKAEEEVHMKVREKLKEKEKNKDKDKDKEKTETGEEKEKESKKPAQEPPPVRRDRSRIRRGRSRSRSPRRSRSPLRSRSQERAEREKRREAQREREKEVSAREEEEHEEKLRQRRVRERERAYRDQLSAWENRERRKAKEYDRELKREDERREDMVHERRHLAEFLQDYDDERDDQQFYKSSLYNRRRSEREIEMEDDEKDRRRETEELETLRLEVMEKQARDKLGQGAADGSSSESSPRREDDDEEDMEVPPRHELEENIPLTKAGYTVPSSFKQIQPAPSVKAPEMKGHPKEKSFGDGIMIPKADNLRQDGESPTSRDSPQMAKLAFGLKKTTGGASGNIPPAKKSKLESIFSTEDEEVELKPKKKLVPIDYSDEDDQSTAAVGGGDVGMKASQSKHGKGGDKEGENDMSMKLALLKPADSGKKLSNEERKKLVQTLVNNIPTSKEEVFKYEMKWDQIDQTLIEKRVGPWINKKITEYIGESEPVLTDFICNKLACHVSPSDILNDIAMVLDDEAEVFVVKLWRLLIYETEAKHLGIAKNY